MKFTFLQVKEKYDRYDDDGNRNPSHVWSHNKGEFIFEDFNLVNCIGIE